MNGGVSVRPDATGPSGSRTEGTTARVKITAEGRQSGTSQPVSSPSPSLSSYARPKGPLCWYSQLDDSQRVLVDDFLSQRQADGRLYDSATVSRALAGELNLRYTDQTVARHRRGDCGCPR